MRLWRFVPRLTVLVMLAGVCACTASAPPPPAKAASQKKAERDPNLDQRQREPRHIAPPPAYGNKVVMAQGAADSSG